MRPFKGPAALSTVTVCTVCFPLSGLSLLVVPALPLMSVSSPCVDDFSLGDPRPLKILPVGASCPELLCNPVLFPTALSGCRNPACLPLSIPVAGYPTLFLALLPLSTFPAIHFYCLYLFPERTGWSFVPNTLRSSKECPTGLISVGVRFCSPPPVVASRLAATRHQRLPTKDVSHSAAQIIRSPPSASSPAILQRYAPCSARMCHMYTFASATRHSTAKAFNSPVSRCRYPYALIACG